MSTDPKEPAFPRNYISDGHNGMTKREYFAAVALQGLCAHTGSYGIGNGPADLSKRAYEIADAMLESGKDGPDVPNPH